jgi:hypothetical protein
MQGAIAHCAVVCRNQGGRKCEAKADGSAVLNRLTCRDTPITKRSGEPGL